MKFIFTKIKYNFLSFLYNAFLLIIAIFLIFILNLFLFTYGPQWDIPEPGTRYPVLSFNILSAPSACFLGFLIVLIYENFRGKKIRGTPLTDCIFFGFTSLVFLNLFSCIFIYCTPIWGAQDDINSSFSQNGVQMFVNGVTTFEGHLMYFHALVMEVIAIALCGLIFGFLRRKFIPKVLRQIAAKKE